MTDLDRLSDPRRAMLAATVVTALFFAGFLGWAATAPLAGAALAPGRVIPDGQRKTVQHLDGGLIREILVDEGHRVEAGDVLFRLDATETTAQHQATLGRWRTRKATEARLLAEQADAWSIDFPAELLAVAAEPGLAALLEDERARLRDRRTLHESQLAALRHRRAQVTAEIEALDASRESGLTQLELLAEEIAGAEQLFAKGLERRPRLLALKRSGAQLEGRLAADGASLVRARAAIEEVDSQIAGLRHARTEEIGRDLLRARAELAELEEFLRTSAERLARTEIRAPVGGTVVELAKHTEGGVVGAGERLLDIVPTEAPLIIEARVGTTDIDEVHPGLEAQVHLSAYRSRHLPRIDGTVRTVSADRLVDPLTGEPYFSARIAVDPAALPAGVALAAGMPAEVVIVTAERTLLDYLLEPVQTILRRGMRES